MISHSTLDWLNNSYPNNYIIITIFFCVQKSYAEARRHYERALALDPGNQMVMDNLKKLDGQNTAV